MNLKQKLNLTNADIVVYAGILAMIAYTLLMLVLSPERLARFVEEDGFAENLTAIMLFGSSVVCIFRARTFAKEGKRMWLLTYVILAFLFFFAMGEEISWGQRIFNIQSGDFFKQNNLQGETNLHNLAFGGVKVNKLIFSQMLFIVLVIYFVFLEFLIRKVRFISNLAHFFNVPLPKLHHTVMMLFSAIIVQGINYPRHAEVLECIFAAIFFLIFLNPKKLSN